MAERGESLSERELDVLRRLAAGESNKAIADGLSISPYTVKTHLRNIYTKLDVSTRTEAMTVALQQGMVSVEMADGPDTAEAEGTNGNGRQALAAESTAAVATAVEDTTESAPPRTAVSHRWRVLSVALLALLVLVAGILLFVQWRDGTLTAATATAEPFTEQPLGETRWASSRPMPEGHMGRAAVAVGLDIYVLGGETAEGVTDQVQVFNTADRTWRRVTNKPTAVSSTTAAELFGEIYVPGGTLADGGSTDIVEAYSPSQNAWRRIAPLPQPLAGALTVAHGGYLYVLGGRNADGVQDTVYVYDPAADSWRPLAPLPEPRADATGGALTGRLYLVGGSDGEARRDSCYTYDPPSDAWDECPVMLRARAGAGAAVLHNRLYIIAGTQPESGATAEHGEVYDPNSQTWTVLNSPPDVTAWTEPGVVYVETRIYAVGGRQGETLSDAVLVYSPLFQTYIPAVPSDLDD